MKIFRNVYNEIISRCPIVPPETGGVLGAYNGIIQNIYFDCENTEYSYAVYTPNINNINKIIEHWTKSKIQFCGLFHSHPDNQELLSNGDIDYITIVMQSMPESISELYFPIVIPKSHIISYRAVTLQNNINIIKDSIEVIS